MAPDPNHAAVGARADEVRSISTSFALHKELSNLASYVSWNTEVPVHVQLILPQRCHLWVNGYVLLRTSGGCSKCCITPGM